MHKHNKYAGGGTQIQASALRFILLWKSKEHNARNNEPDVTISSAEHVHKSTVWICTLANQPWQASLLNAFEYANVPLHKKPWQAVIMWFQWVQIQQAEKILEEAEQERRE